MMWRLSQLMVTGLVLLSLSGCSYLSIPAGDYRDQAKGATGRRDDDQSGKYDGSQR